MSASVPTTIGRYQILRSLGEGGMGSVYLARDPAIDRQVAIKLMRSGFDDPQMRERFVREARSIGRLHHQNIVTVFDVGEHDGEPFITMEYIEGQTLSALAHRTDPVALGDKLAWIDGLFAGLHYAHKAGLIHRDIKPANVMVDSEGSVKILDFGIARAAAVDATQQATQAGTILGTLNYMSPEQLTGKPVDHRTDIFSAGAVCYEVLSARMAFPGDIQTGVLHLILSAGPEPIETAAPGIDPDLAALVNKCLARDVAQRYADLGLARKDLAQVRRKLDGGAAADRTVVIVSQDVAAAEAKPVRTPGPDTRAELMRLRKERIADQLTAARTALSRAEHTAALESVRQALIIDPENAEALALQDDAEKSQQGYALIQNAQHDLEQGALTAASRQIDQALALQPAMPAALALRANVAAARKAIEDTAHRAQALAEALGRARQQITAGQLEAAGGAVAEALAIDPASQDAQAERTRLAGLIEDVRRRERQERERHDEDARVQAEVARKAAARQQADEAERLAKAQAQLAKAQAQLAKAQAQEDKRRNKDAREAERLAREADRRVNSETQRAAQAASQIAAVPAATTRAPSSVDLRWFAVAAVVLILVAVGAYALWHRTPSSASPAAATPTAVSVLFSVRPWANIDSIVRKSDGKAIDAGKLVTPCLVLLEPGEYHVVARNPYFATFPFDVTVAPGEYQEVRVALPDLKADEEATSVIR